MKIELGHTIIGNEQAIINYRLKLIGIFEVLFNDYIFSVKASSLLSSIFKKIKTINKGALHLNTFIRYKNSIDGAFCIELNNTKADSFHQLIKQYNDSIILTVINDNVLITIKGRLNSEFIDKAKEIHNKPSLDELMLELQLKNKHLEESFENLKKAKDLNARMESELEVAKNIQLSMLPVDFPKNEQLDLFASLIPANEVGGDFYDFHMLDDNLLYFVMGDVSGKGVPAALFMAVTKTLLRSNATNNHSPANILNLVNNEITRENKNYMFVTLFLAIVDLNSGKMTYTNAGHCPTYIKNKSKKEVIKLDKLSGPVIGIMEDIKYKEEEIQLNINDVILTYTDGVTEAINIDGDLFTDNKLEQFFTLQEFKSSQSTVNSITYEVKEFEKGKQQADDITIMAINYLKKNETFSIEITNEMSELQKVNSGVQSFLENKKIKTVVINKIHIINDELLSNLIKYAYEEKKTQTIKVNFKLSKTFITITIKDYGNSFNPFTFESETTEQPIEERTIGGLGITIVKSMIDDYTYKSKNQSNILTLKIKI